PCTPRFAPREHRPFAKTLAELLRQPADALRRTADVEWARRHGAMIERAQDKFIGVTLPNHIHVAHCEIKRRDGMYACRDVKKNAIAHVDRIVEADDAARCFVYARKMREHRLAGDARVGVDAGRWNRRRRFCRAAFGDIDVWVNAAG